MVRLINIFITSVVAFSFLVARTVKIQSLSKLLVYNAVLTIVATLYIRSP